MSVSQQFVTNVTSNTSPGISPLSKEIQNALFFSSTNTSSTLTILASTTILDGYNSSGTQASTTNAFSSSVTFILNNPLYTDDDSDLIEFQVRLNSTGSINTSQSFQILCKLSNLGTVAVTPIYQTTSNGNGIISVFVNKWFLMKSPGSTYCFTLMGLSGTSTP